MAADGGERRMVFDIRGRRKHVVKFVYAILALLMGASLFLVVGPVNIGSILGNSSSESSSSLLEEQAEQIEHRLKKNPDDPQLLLNLTRAQVNVGNSLVAVNPETGQPAPTVESKAQLEKASATWSKYLKATDEPNPSGALLMAPAFFSLAQTSRTGAEAEANLDSAAAAQQLVAKARPSLGSLSTLAIYRYFAFDKAGAAQARKEAVKYTHNKFERENLGNELDETAKRAREFEKSVAEFNKASKGQGKESLENPLGGLGGSTTLTP